jgi:hypothetical protein
MDARSILLAMLPIAMTLVNYAIVRDLLWGILLGNKSKKSAQKLKDAAKGWEKFTQIYMTPHITKYQKEYKTWKTMKLALCILTIAQLIGFTLLVVLRQPFWLVVVITCVIVAFNLVLFGIMMNQTETSDNKHNRKGSPWKFEQ